MVKKNFRGAGSLVGFQYKLQKFVNLKTSQTSQAASMISSALGDVEQILQQMKQLEAERNRLSNQLAEASEVGLTAGLLHGLQAYLEYIDGCIKQERLRLFQAQKHLEECELVWMDCKKDEKLWHTLKDKSYERFLYDQNRLTQIELDEIALIRRANH